MSHSLMKRLANINQTDKDVTFGYMRRAQKSYKCLNIPIALSHICLLYFYQFDYFAECGLNMKINEGKDIVTNTGGDGSTGYGALHIANDPYSSAFIYQWQFAVLPYKKTTIQGFVAIGIADHNYTNLGKEWYGNSDDNIHIALNDDGLITRTLYYDRIKNNYRFAQCWEYGPSGFAANDVVIITLDMKMKKLEFVVHTKTGTFVSGKKLTVRFEGNDWKYRVAIFADDYGAAVQMLKFEKVIQMPPSEGEHMFQCFERCKRG